MKPLRKGARAITVEGVQFSWFSGKTFVEIRNRETDRVFNIPRHRVEVEVVGCDCCNEGWGHAVTPGRIGDFLRNHRDEHELFG